LRMCCLGAYLFACGVPKRSLKKGSLPAEIEQRIAEPRVRALLLRDMHGLGYEGSSFASRAASINDDRFLSIAKREKMIVAHFGKKGIKIRFTGPLFLSKKTCGMKA